MQSARNENSTLGGPSRWKRAGLLFAGVIATLALLPYSWGRILVTTMLVGAPEPNDPNLKGVPDGLWVSRVEASHFEAGTCYVTLDGHRSDNFAPWVFKTTDFGKTWANIGKSLPDGQVAYVIREDPVNPDLLFLGTEFGIFVSTDGGKRWERFMNRLPTVAVHDILIHPLCRDLIIGTHGRGIWICDDITALEQSAPAAASAPAHLFDPRTATQWISISRGGSRGQFLFRGENPPRGALIHYNLGPETKDATLEISDVEGKAVFSTKLDGKPGPNRFTWEFRFNPPELAAGEQAILEKLLKASAGEERMRLNAELEKSLAERGMRYTGVNTRTGRLNDIAAAANAGVSSKPVSGYSTPAASGTPSAL